VTETFRDGNDGGGQFTIHGKPVVVSSYVTSGTAVVLDAPGSTTLYVREDARIDWAQSGWVDATPDRDMFTHNELRARGEARVGIHVWRPSAIHTVTGF
jgi:HK97 family phage major capsid protein